MSHGRAKVYKATLDEDLVAVKFLHQSLEKDDYFKKGFQEEMKQLRNIRHRNILSLVGAGEWENRGLFIVTEFCELGSLHDVLVNEQIRIDWPLAHSFALQTSQV